MAADGREVYIIDEVVHFGGFFQGDTVGLKAHPLEDADDERTLTVDDHIWDNLTDKHNLKPGMALALEFHLGDVSEASVLGSSTLPELKQAITERNISPDPNIIATAYHCKQCGMWIAQTPERTAEGYACCVCHTPLGAA